MTSDTVRIGLVYDSRFAAHDPGELHIECPERLGVIVDWLEKSGLIERLCPIESWQATPEQLSLVHEPAYVDIVRMMCDEGFRAIGSEDTRICSRSYDVAALAAGGGLAACDAVLSGTVERVFCAVRPPGHHAETDQAMGFCIFNNVAIAAEHLIRNHGLARVAIVDFDVHHGNGTQHVFEARSDVLYISVHERPGSIGFPESGEADERGVGAGHGFTLNVPLNFGSQEAEYRAAFDDQILPALDQYRPELLLVSAGFDALSCDRVSHVSLEPESYGWITDRLVEVADRHAGGRLISVLEGGYDLAHLGKAVAAHVSALMPGAAEDANG